MLEKTKKEYEIEFLKKTKEQYFKNNAKINTFDYKFEYFPSKKSFYLWRLLTSEQITP